MYAYLVMHTVLHLLTRDEFLVIRPYISAVRDPVWKRAVRGCTIRVRDSVRSAESAAFPIRTCPPERPARYGLPCARAPNSPNTVLCGNANRCHCSGHYLEVPNQKFVSGLWFADFPGKGCFRAKGSPIGDRGFKGSARGSAEPGYFCLPDINIYFHAGRVRPKGDS
jgi:hypothetical protein